MACGGTLYQTKSFLVGPEKARSVRQKALSAIALGLLMMVYWGGYGPWPVMDNAALVSLRHWVEPGLLYGGTASYGLAWLLRWV